MSAVGTKISEHLELLAQLEVENNGKPIWEARYCFNIKSFSPSMIQFSRPTILNLTDHSEFLLCFHRLDIQSCADCFLYYGGIAATISGQHIQLPNGSFGLIKREPLLEIKLFLNLIAFVTTISEL